MFINLNNCRLTTLFLAARQGQLILYTKILWPLVCLQEFYLFSGGWETRTPISSHDQAFCATATLLFHFRLNFFRIPELRRSCPDNFSRLPVVNMNRTYLQGTKTYERDWTWGWIKSDSRSRVRRYVFWRICLVRRLSDSPRRLIRGSTQGAQEMCAAKRFRTCRHFFCPYAVDMFVAWVLCPNADFWCSQKWRNNARTSSSSILQSKGNDSNLPPIKKI